jgi:hypothetical protein
MNEATINSRSLRTGWINVIIGAWLIVSPFVLGFAHDAAGLSNNIVVGAALVLLTFASAKNGLLKALIAFMGVWLFDSAFVLCVSQPAYMWNNLILAFMVIAFDIASEAP